MEDPTKSNSARRLLSLLTAVTNIHGDTMSDQAWAQVLEVPHDVPSLFFGQMSKVTQLPDVVKQDVERYCPLNKKDDFLRWHPRLNNAFKTFNPKSKIQDFNGRINQIDTFTLGLCSDILDQYSSEPSYDHKELQKIQAEAFNLSQSILNSELDPDVKRYLSDLLAKVQWAIREYRISGIEPLRQALTSIAGEIALEGATVKKTAEIKEAKDVWKLLGRAALLIHLGKSFIGLADKTLHILHDPILNATPTVEIVAEDETLV